jgi:hypothetical protein
MLINRFLPQGDIPENLAEMPANLVSMARIYSILLICGSCINETAAAIRMTTVKRLRKLKPRPAASLSAIIFCHPRQAAIGEAATLIDTIHSRPEC